MAFTDKLANRGSISTGSYDIDYSCAFDKGTSARMTKDCASAVVAEQKTFTFSCWVKRMQIGSNADVGDSYILECGETDSNNGRSFFRFRDDQFFFAGGGAYWFRTRRLFRDNSGWYHIVVAVDTTDGTAGNRHRLYVNGVEETDFETEASVDQNHQHGFSRDEKHTVGGSHIDSDYETDLKIAEFHMVGGSQLAPTDFGEFDSDSGIWKPIEYTGSHGTNGFYLDFADSSNMGNDASGGLDFTETNLDTKEQTLDTPTNSFCVWSQTGKNMYDTGTQTIDRYNSRIYDNTSWSTTIGTHPFVKGKWYWEIEIGGANYIAFGIISVDKIHLLYENTYAEAVAYRGWDGGAYARDGNPSVSSSIGASGNYCRIYVDMDNNKFTVIRGSTTVIDEQNIGGCSENDQLSIPFIRTHAVNTVNNGHGMQTNFGGGCLLGADTKVGQYYNSSDSSSPYTDDNGYGEFDYSPNANSKSYYALCTKNIAEFG